jgi:hypothetical protein
VSSNTGIVAVGTRGPGKLFDPVSETRACHP